MNWDLGFALNQHAPKCIQKQKSHPPSYYLRRWLLRMQGNIKTALWNIETWLCERDAGNSLVEFVFLSSFFFFFFFSSIKINCDSYLLTGVLLLQSFLRIVILTVTFLQNFPSSLPAKWALIEKYQLKTLNISDTRTFLNILWGQETQGRKYPIHHCTYKTLAKWC